MHLHISAVRARRWTRAVAVGLASAVLAALAITPANAATTTPGDATSTAYTQSSVRAMTWNICGEAGGATAASAAYCPDRFRPDLKAAAIATVVQQRNLNAIMLQEVCSGNADDGYGNSSSTPPNPSDLEDVAADLGTGWTFQWVPVERPDGTTRCRDQLSGTLSVAIGVKGSITSYHAEPLPVPLNMGADKAQVLCVTVAGWTTNVCTTHMANIGDATVYANEVSTVKSVISGYPNVVLGGDFNTSDTNNLQSLYSMMPECDQQSYYPGDAANEATHFTYNPTVTGTNDTITAGYYTPTKIDYLFSTNGFTGCDSWTQMADQADYRTSVQPSCVTDANPIVCTPTGISDHAPLYGYTKGGPVLDWSLKNGSGTTAADASGSGNTGSLSSGASWSTDHGGSAALDGSTGTVTGPNTVLNTTGSFTVSAWAKVNPGAGTSVVLSQDGTNISGTMLWYNQPDNTWRFAMPKSDSTGWSVDQVVSSAPAQTGVWNQLTGVFDAAAGTLTLYVNGTSVGTASHTALWSATGPFVAGRDLVNGSHNAYFHGELQSVRAFDYPMTAAEVSSFATGLAAPTGTTTTPTSDNGDAGCSGFSPYGTVHTLTPTLTAHVAAPDPSLAIHADFAIWDDTDSTQPQPITMGGTGSASAPVTGSGTVSVQVPTLIAGHLYGWYAKTDNGSTTSATTTVCHFYAAAN